MPIVRQLFTKTRQLSVAIRDVGRLREIIAILFKHGFGYLLRDIDIPGIGHVSKSERDKNTAVSNADAPERALRVINELGPTFIKLGQILSTRPNLMPASFVSALEQLQDQVDPIPFEDIQAQLQKNLGDDGMAAFTYIDPVCLASASIAQVHRATLNDGSEVVVKVQRPGVRAKLLRDIEVLKFLAKSTESNFPEAKLFGPVGIICEIERSVRAECDFTTEANNIRRFTKNFEDAPHIVIPTTYPELTTSEVLTESFLDGVKITQAKEKGHDLDVIAVHYLNAAYQMLFKDGFFHGDLHPGNVLILEDSRLAFIDFGMVGRLTPDMRDNCIDMVVALLRQDLRTTARIFWEIGIKDESVSYQSFESSVFDIMDRYFVDMTAGDLAIGQFFAEITGGAVKHRIKMPTGYTMMFKSMVTTEGLIRMLAPTIDPVEFARPHVEKLIAERYSQERMEKELIYYLGGFSRIARRLPTALHELVSDIEEHRLRFGVEMRVSPTLRGDIKRIESRRIRTAFSIAFMICGTMAIPHLPPFFLGLPAFSLGAFVLGGVGFANLFLGYPRDKQ